MQREQWVERYTNRLWEYCPEPGLMWDMEHLGPWIEDEAIDQLIEECPDDPERAAGVIYDQVIEAMDMQDDVGLSEPAPKVTTPPVSRNPVTLTVLALLGAILTPLLVVMFSQMHDDPAMRTIPVLVVAAALGAASSAGVFLFWRKR